MDEAIQVVNEYKVGAHILAHTNARAITLRLYSQAAPARNLTAGAPMTG